MEVAAVVEDEVEDHLDPATVARGDEPVEVGERAETRVHAHVVGDVVPEVEVR
jgi:hypothetical protein